MPRVKRTGRRRMVAAGHALLQYVPGRVRRPLVRFGWRAYERALALGARRGFPPADKLPLPPARLRVLVARTPDQRYFLDSGAMERAAIADLVAELGSPVESMKAILDFGCGCGRVARYWADLDAVKVCGCDYNPELVDWCRANLPFMDVRLNDLQPPLPFERQFDLIYALSVFTHLSERMQHAWLRACRDALSPGGILVFTTHGERYLDRLSPRERADFEHGRLVTRFTDVEGANLCLAYHPPEFVAEMMDGLVLDRSITSGLPRVVTHTPLYLQDVHVARKPAPRT